MYRALRCEGFVCVFTEDTMWPCLSSQGVPFRFPQSGGDAFERIPLKRKLSCVKLPRATCAQPSDACQANQVRLYEAVYRRLT